MKAFEALAEFSELLNKFDLRKIAKLAQNVDVGSLLTGLGNMSAQDLTALTGMLARSKNRKKRDLPVPHGDFYDLASTLPPEAILTKAQRKLIASLLAERLPALVPVT